MKIHHYDLFAGIGGFSLALDTIFYDQEIKHTFCEWEAFPTALLKKHWSEGIFYGDIADSNCGNRGVAKEWKPIRPSGHHAQKPINESINIHGQMIGAKLRLQPAFTAYMMGYPTTWAVLPLVEVSTEKKH